MATLTNNDDYIVVTMTMMVVVASAVTTKMAAAKAAATTKTTKTTINQKAAAIVAEMAVAYPELAKAQAHIAETLKQEEERFAETLVQGMRIFEQDVAQLKDSVIPGKTIFTLYDTYGFPVDLTNDIARERGLTLDMHGFNEAMAVQKARSRMQDGFKNNYAVEVKSEESSVFHGYDTLSVAAVLREIIDELLHQRAGGLIIMIRVFPGLARV